MRARRISGVALQQSAFGQPLDDLILDAISSTGEKCRVSLQVKRALTISDATTNEDFRRIVADSYDTALKSDFREGVDRVGFATGTIAEQAKRDLDTVCEWARDSSTAEVFFERFRDDGQASQRHQNLLNTVKNILGGERNDTSEQSLYHLLKHFIGIRFDFLHEGSTDEAVAVSYLKQALSPRDQDRAFDLWTNLRTICRESSGRSANFDRQTLLGRFYGQFRFTGASYLSDDMAKLSQQSSLNLSSIATDANGFAVSRPSLQKNLEDSIEKNSLLLITGVPGTGKSAMLRTLAQKRLSAGPTLVLKSDRLEGSSWSTFATNIGLDCHDGRVILSEISAQGNSVLFIDGLDRIGIDQRGIVVDILNIITNDENLKSRWTVVATLRDSGLEPLRTWFPHNFSDGGQFATIPVQGFDDGEAQALAAAKPQLRQLLFATGPVREIVRRPFFATVIMKTISETGEVDKAPHSETELIDCWWNVGGSLTADTANLSRRQQTLIQLAKLAIQKIGSGISPPLTIDPDTVDQLVNDGILSKLRSGNVRFAHDIFFEWSFLKLLESAEQKWHEEIKAAGEIPMLARPVELLSQQHFHNEEDWKDQLVAIESAFVRSQWTRAWLLGPVGSATFRKKADKFLDTLLEEDASRLTQLLVWFQAEKTKPNPIILKSDQSLVQLPLDRRIRAADALAIPTDFMAWQRLCDLILNNITLLPLDNAEHIVSIFEVWQNGWADFPNEISAGILKVVQDWLLEIEDNEHPEKASFTLTRWDVSRKSLAETEDRLRALLLRAARAYPKSVDQYLERLTKRDRLRSHVFSQVIIYAPLLSVTHAARLVEITSQEILDELPEKQAEKAARDPFRYSDISHYEWSRLAIDKRGHRFHPASPVRQPYEALFKNASSQGLELVRRQTNHAILAWRQLYQFDRSVQATPIPLTLAFPWGKREFWGDGRVYQWFRGDWAPDPVAAGLMALERWAFAEIDNGQEPDQVIQQVLEGHDSVAVLGIAVGIALKTCRASATTLPLATSQKLWHWDIARFSADQGMRSNLIGFMNPSDRADAEAVKEQNEWPVRKLEIRQLAQLFVLGSDKSLCQAAQDAISNFPNDLPIDFEEQKAHLDDRDKTTAEIWAQFANPENYEVHETEKKDGVIIQLNNPRLDQDDIKQQQAGNNQYIRSLSLLNWTIECFEKACISSRLTVEQALALAKEQDSENLFKSVYQIEDPLSNWQSAVAGTAAVLLRFGDELDDVDTEWAVDTCLRAAGVPGDDTDHFNRSVLPHHACLSASAGLVALIRRNLEKEEARKTLINLACHQNEEISARAITDILSLWEHDHNFSWLGLQTAIDLSIGMIEGAKISPYGYGHESHEKRRISVQKSATKALRSLSLKGTPELPAIPDAWVYAPPRRMSHLPYKLRQEQTASIWRDPDVFLRWDFFGKVLDHVPAEKLVAERDYEEPILNLCDQLVRWTTERLAPAWSDDEDRDHNRSDLYEWRHKLGTFLARISLSIDVSITQERILKPIFTLDDELSDSIINPYVSRLACDIMDNDDLNERPIQLMMLCLERVLQDKVWTRKSYRNGDLSGWDLPSLVKEFFLVQIEYAGGAARFVNGDWSEIARLIPIAERFISAVGDVPAVLSAYLTLCERSKAHYPSRHFVDMIHKVLSKQQGMPIGWRQTDLVSRIAELVQYFSENERTLSVQDTTSMLAILDRLVDMGDRRSAALQSSETFRNVTPISSAA